jgi:hypothetical protein
MKAFPTDRLGVIKDSRQISINESQQDGMDLRDYFAAKALQGDISRYENKDNPEYWTTEAVAERSYAMADAMMKAREK